LLNSTFRGWRVLLNSPTTRCELIFIAFYFSKSPIYETN
jgi:hypothetical protein